MTASISTDSAVTKEIPNANRPNSKATSRGDKPRDLEERTALFAAEIRRFVRRLPRTLSNIEHVKQLVRASGSVAANCIEANEALGDKDRVMRSRICRKEAKERQLWLRLLHTGDAADFVEQRDAPRQEAHELKLIFSTLVKKLA